MDFLKKLGAFRVALILGSSIFVLLLIGFVIFKLTATSKAILYTNLNPDDSAIIISRLEAMGIDYEVNNSGKDLLVPVVRVPILRMQFAQEGIPKSGSVVGYEIFDKTDSLGSSQFVNNVNLLRALEGELAKTISSLGPVDAARVHIVMPKKEMFSKSGSTSSASIVLKMKNGQTLSKQEVASVSHIVATAVPDLKVENITIVDNKGKPLKLSASEDNMAATLTDTVAEYQRVVEDKLKEKLISLLEKSVGIGKVQTNVAAEINFDREITNAETFDPEKSVVRSKRTSDEADNEKDATAEVSVSTNLGNPTAGGSISKNKNKNDEVINYEVSKTITNKISEAGRIKRLSIAILVDGNYTFTTNPDTKAQEVNYTPRTEQELQQLKTLAASAVGLDTSRGDNLEVINMRFSDDFLTMPIEEKPLDWLKNDLENIVQTIVIGTVIILLALLVVRPVLIRNLESQKEQDEQELLATNPLIPTAQFTEPLPPATAQQLADAALQDEEEIELSNTMSPDDKRKASLVRQINEIIDTHPEEAVSIIRNWLYSMD